jgi:hypothetical protein
MTDSTIEHPVTSDLPLETDIGQCILSLVGDQWWPAY